MLLEDAADSIAELLAAGRHPPLQPLSLVSTRTTEIIIDLAMPTFLWSGRTPSGQEEAEEVSAETAMEARKILEARGWTGLRQHTTEVHDFARRQRQESVGAENCPKLAPKEALQYHQGTAPGFWSLWFKSLRESTMTILLLVAVMVVMLLYDHHGHRVPGYPFFIRLSAILLACVIFMYPLFHWWFHRTKRLFQRLHTARVWHRWDEVLLCLDQLAKHQRTAKNGIGDFEMARYRALALSGLGRLDEALAGYCAAAEKAKTPPWLFHTFQAGIYVTAKQYDQALACYRLALEAAADKSTVCLDLGTFLVQRFNRPEEARQLLAQAETAQLSELARVHVLSLRGIIAFRDKDFAAMNQHLRAALAGFEKHAAARPYIFEPSLLTCKGYLAVSCAALGRLDEARRYFAESKDYLAIIDFNELITEYLTLIGNSKNSPGGADLRVGTK